MTIKDNTFHVLTLGCKINIYESESISYLLASNGFSHINSYSNCALVIINTCTVTNKADAKCRNVIRKVKRTNPDCMLVVCGCLANTDTSELKSMHEVDIIIKNTDKDKILMALDLYESQKDIEKPFIFETTDDGSFNYTTPRMDKHSRAFMKIQDGCDNYCSYCKIPYARGSSRSKKTLHVLEDIEGIIDNGYEEIVLSGINIGTYDDNGNSFSDLLSLIVNKFPDTRFRISSLEPQYVDDHFLEVFQAPNICPHAHIPLQSGCDAILKLMDRRYNTDEYRNIIHKLREVKKNLFLSSDLILGFPGETEDDFETTYRFVEEINFSFIHLFGFSPRKGTKAITMSPKIPERVRDDRVRKVRALVDSMNQAYKTSLSNHVCEVVVERFKNGFYMGKSEHYLDVRIDTDKELLIKKRYPVLLNDITGPMVTGSLITG